MFTGIITHLGVVSETTTSTLAIETPKDLHNKLSLGTSISVNGICLTVTEIQKPNLFTIDFMPETAKKTTIQYLHTGDKVNLELSATPETFLAGHLVQGHVDGISEVLHIEKEGNSFIFTFSLDKSLSKYVVNKGSVTINGISLTVIEETDTQFTVGIIPHTWDNTMLHTLKVGNFVNIEIDVIAKYVEKLLAHTK
jgi:riboflavin synthase